MDGQEVLSVRRGASAREITSLVCLNRRTIETDLVDQARQPDDDREANVQSQGPPHNAYRTQIRRTPADGLIICPLHRRTPPHSACPLRPVIGIPILR